jgi:hypothetical protein
MLRLALWASLAVLARGSALGSAVQAALRASTTESSSSTTPAYVLCTGQFAFCGECARAGGCGARLI